MKCPHCKKLNVTAGHILGHSTSKPKAASSRLNGKLGGRPKGKKNKENKADWSLVLNKSISRLETTILKLAPWVCDTCGDAIVGKDGPALNPADAKPPHYCGIKGCHGKSWHKRTPKDKFPSCTR